MSSLITADWFPVGKDTFFRTINLYNMSWMGAIDVDNMLICPAQYGGPIAIVRDRKKLTIVQVATKPVINIFSSSGEKLGAILWNSGQLLHIGWSSEEHLLCIKSDGQVLVYNMFGTLLTMFSMGEEASVTKIVEAKIFPSSAGTGLAVLTTKFRVFIVNSVTDPKVRQYPPIPSSLSRETPNAWEIVSERDTSVIISTGKDLTLLRPDEPPSPLYPEFREDSTGFIDMAVSLDNKHIAILTATGILWLGSSDMKRKYCEINTKCTSRPKQIAWCGADAVVGNWANELQLISKLGGTAKIPSPGPVWLAPEIDGVRVLSSFNHELIQKVPQVTKKIFSINSTEPGSFLLEASKRFERQSDTSYEYIHLVRGKMEQAVSQCLEGAGYEFNSNVQKSLLRAAKVGRTFAPDAATTEFVNMCRVLRVLNNVRSERVGIPLTYAQLNHLSLRTLLDRLVARRFYKIAIEMAQYLKLPDVEGASRILAHWACHKVKQTHIQEDELAADIGKRLKLASGIYFSEIANQAIDAGRTQLAIKLLEYEPRASLQVPLLLRLDQRKAALEKAIRCGDTDLIFFVILTLKESMALGELHYLIRSYPLALSLYNKHCRMHSPGTLRDIYEQEDNHIEQAEWCLRDYFDPSNSTKEVSLIRAAECYGNAKEQLCSSICKDQQKLLNAQKNLREKFDMDFVGKSVHDTIQMLLSLGEIKLAESLRSEHKVPDRHFWWLRLQTMAENGSWDEMEKFAKAKKSPIGYEPFVDICLNYNKPIEAGKYLPRVREDLKVKYYVRAGRLDEAAKIAFEQREEDALRYILGNGGSQNIEIATKIDKYLTQLNAKK